MAVEHDDIPQIPSMPAVGQEIMRTREREESGLVSAIG